MARLLFRLGNVPEEEAEEVRRLLDERGFHTYESRAGVWGLGVAAIWLHDEARFEEARELLDAYQQELAGRMRREHDALAERGETPTLWKRLQHHPVRTLLVAAAVLAILALTLLPFLGLVA